MATRRIIYLFAWIAALVFFCAYQQWFAWLTLLIVVCLPIFSLLISLPAMLTARLELRLPAHLTAGIPCQLALECRSQLLPPPPWKCRINVSRPVTCQQWRVKNGSSLPTEHCGALICSVQKAKICDYLGLFSIPLRLPDDKTVFVRPKPVPIRDLPQLEQHIARSWQPKRGGGFAENHELRLYRPGDSVQQIHWKLSAKAGKLILREPMEPERSRVLLRLDLMGSDAELDRKLGRLLWLGRHLTRLHIHYEIQCLTANGCEQWHITTQKELDKAIDSILGCSSSTQGSIQSRVEHAAWQFYIGGGPDEA